MPARFSFAQRTCAVLLFALSSGCAKDSSSDATPRTSTGSDAGSGATGEAGDGNAAAGAAAVGNTSSGGSEADGGSGEPPGAGGEAMGGSAGTSVNPPYVIEPGLEDKVELEVRYLPRSTSEDVQPTIEVENKILTSVLLSQLEIRYYMQLDGEVVTEPYEMGLNSAAIPDPVKCCHVALAEFIVIELVPMAEPVAGADHYVKITFTTDDSIFLRLTDVAEIKLANYTNDDIVQSNDYSFADVSTLTVSETITVYRDGELVYGTPPE